MYMGSWRFLLTHTRATSATFNSTTNTYRHRTTLKQKNRRRPKSEYPDREKWDTCVEFNILLLSYGLQNVRSV